ncbi:MAG: DUF4080 domain-containing protein [Oligoflexia bacterium]|nr:DUF4080 domain-containing protein [Oligoflexia bacterium]
MSASSSVLLTTLNARYSHSAFGLRYLYANLGEELRLKTKIPEFTISQNPRDIAESILRENPRLVGFGVYIWNTRQTQEVISILKQVRPEIRIVLGGPEVSYESSTQAICALADLTIQGEADFLFRDLCRDFLEAGKWPSGRFLSGELPLVTDLSLPYRYYTDSDIAHRVIYVEASRGCPYKCEYCLSSLDKSVRNFDLDLFLSEMRILIDRGARQFKFIDRTFNLSVATSSRILQFFLDRISLGLFLHFEMVPDRLPSELRELIARFPKGSLQFEIGIQTWSPLVAQLVSRRLDYAKIRENFAFLAESGVVHTHADLIAGLPGETIESFAHGFDAVAELAPDEIQVGILKRLKGTPIIRHDREWEMVYHDQPPFQILQTKTMSFEVLQGVGRFAHFWDLIANSGNFKATLRLIAELSRKRSAPSLYWEFDELARFLSARHPQGHGVALLNLVESVWLYLTESRGVERETARQLLIQDYAGTVKRDIPAFLRDGQVYASPAKESRSGMSSSTPSRQRRHLEAAH